MSQLIPIQQASDEIMRLLKSLHPGDEIVFTDNDRPVARLVPAEADLDRVPGDWIGKVEIVDDSDDHVAEHFKDYMP